MCKICKKILGFSKPWKIFQNEDKSSKYSTLRYLEGFQSPIATKPLEANGEAASLI